MEEKKEYTLEERLNHVSVWRNSGLLLANYSRQTGISLKSLRYWATIEAKKARRRKKKMGAGFLPITISGELAQPAGQIIIELPKGIRIILDGSVRPEFIKELVS